MGIQYNISINQRLIVESGLKLDLQDACILDFLYRFSLSPKIEKKLLNNKIYCWFKYSHICDSLPLLNMKKDSVYRRIKLMVDVGLLEAHPENQVSGKSFLHITDLLLSLYFKPDEPTDINPNPLRIEIRTPTDENPNHTNTIYTNEFLSNDKNKCENNSDLFSSAGVDAPVLKKEKSYAKKEKTLLRENSLITAQYLKSKIVGQMYTGANFEYYYECALAWSDKRENKAIDWVATIRNFILNDFKAGKVVKGEVNQAQILKGTEEILNNWNDF